MSDLYNHFREHAIGKLQKELGLKNSLSVPTLVKVVVNIGVGKMSEDKTQLEKAMQDLQNISGQKPVKTYAHKSIAGFKIRKGHAIGCKVTLRGKRMYEFLEKLFNIVLPRTRDFRGLRLEGFDGHGNYSIGLEEQAVFPEVDAAKIDRLRSLEVSIITTAKTNAKGEVLLKVLGCPFRTAE